MGSQNTEIIDIIGSTVRLKSELNTDGMDVRTGSITTKGGVSISKDLYVAGNLIVDGTATIATDSNATQLQGIDIDATPPTANQILQYNSGANEWQPTGSPTIPGPVTINSDLFVNGTTTSINTTELDVADNIIRINDGEVGTGVTAGSAGLEIDRGSSTNYQIIFDESDDTLKIGEIGSLQAVATREDIPIDTAVTFWDATDGRLETDSTFTFNAGTDTLTIENVTINNDLTITGTADICDIVCTGDFTVTVPNTNGVRLGTTNNSISAANATVSGGDNNSVTEVYGTVAGGDSNTASGNYAMVAGGLSNTASGMYSFAAGRSCTANMNNSFALGYNATNNNTGCFCFADGSGTATTNSASNEMTIRASGGVRLLTDTNVSATNGLRLAASGNRWERYSGALMQADAVQLQTRTVSASAPSANDILEWSGTEWAPVTPPFISSTTWTTFSPGAGTNVTAGPSLVINDARSITIGKAVHFAFDLQLLPTGSVSFVELTGLPETADSVIGTRFASAILIQRVSDSLFSVAELSVAHGATAFRIQSIFTSGETYNIVGQLTYSIA